MRHRSVRTPFVPILIAALITSSVTPLPSSAQSPNPPVPEAVELPDAEIELPDPPEPPEVEEPEAPEPVPPPGVEVEPAAVIAAPADARTHGLESLRLALAVDGGVPLPSNLSEIVRDRAAAIQLGKALFWDMQVGSDGVQSCAT